jgi:hypothetical protein
MARKGWLTLLLEQRLRDGLPIAADPSRYLTRRYRDNYRLRRYVRTKLDRLTKKHSLTRVMGPRGGYWTSVLVRDPAAHGEAIWLRWLGQTSASEYWVVDEATPIGPNRLYRTMWRIRHYRGQPYLCLKPRERRWYDPPWGYLVA